MNTTTHPVGPEDLMALLDGELASAEARAVSEHLEQCVECAGIVEQFRGVSQAMSGWSVPDAPSSLEEAVRVRAARAASTAKDAKPVRSIRVSLWNWRLWAIGGGGAVAAALVVMTVALSLTLPSRKMVYVNQPSRQAEMGTAEIANSATPPPPPVVGSSVDRIVSQQQVAGFAMRGEAVQSAAKLAPGGVAVAGGQFHPRDSHPLAATSAAPMIARTVSLTILVKDFAGSRASLDAILARHQGYSAQLNVNTPEGMPRSLHGSLRIPSAELGSTLAELKALGRVQNESQAGEEVTRQHADLVARLKNSRETEARLQAILQQRTGKIEDVLQVEEEIARVRGEIENMESDQLALEHRVVFATVDLQLSEEYKAQLNSPDSSAFTRMHNAFVAGMQNAAGTVLGIVLFFEEYGPVLLIWTVILGLPVFLVWRRYRRMNAGD
jgi:anti-sigma factor RsiW